jgi:hypothetical protein
MRSFFKELMKFLMYQIPEKTTRTFQNDFNKAFSDARKEFPHRIKKNEKKQRSISGDQSSIKIPKKDSKRT